MKENVIVEIPKNSNIKYEIEDGVIKVDRILYGAMKYPLNYGFFKNTIDWDGDPLDALIFADQEFMPGVEVPVRIIGAVKMIDGGETDTKILTVIDVDPRYKNVKSIKDIEKHYLDEIQDFFENYKNLQKKEVKINGFENDKYAIKELKETRKLYKEYGSMKSNEFVELMRKKHPEKYE